MTVPRDDDAASAASVTAAQDLLARIERDLGVGVLVDAVEDGEPFRIHALLSFGTLQREIEVTGDTEAGAWAELARRAAAWRTSDEVSLINQYWGG